MGNGERQTDSDSDGLWPWQDRDSDGYCECSFLGYTMLGKEYTCFCEEAETHTGNGQGAEADILFSFYVYLLSNCMWNAFPRLISSGEKMTISLPFNITVY